MSEVTLQEQAPGRPPPPGCPPIMDISQWVERYSLTVISTSFPHKLFAYQATIIRAERNYEAGRWVAYNRQFRREALSRKDLNWSTPDPRLYSESVYRKGEIPFHGAIISYLLLPFLDLAPPPWIFHGSQLVNNNSYIT